MLNETKPANEINAKLLFGEENGVSLSEHPFHEEVAWMKQFVTLTEPVTGFFLVEGNEDSPTRIWFGEVNRYDAPFTCIYEDTQ